jgi:hypothetical protein
MRVLATALAPGFSITLAQDADGLWHFVSWQRSGYAGKAIDAPAETDQQLRFATADDAVSYFRTIIPN